MSLNNKDDFDIAISKAKQYKEPRRTNELRKIVKSRFSKKGLAAAMDAAKHLGHDLSENDCLKIVEKLICP
jgi:hypothetical protein